MSTENQKTPDISNLPACITEAFDAMTANKETPEPASLDDLDPHITKIESSANKFAKAYADILPGFLKDLKSFDAQQKRQRAKLNASDVISLPHPGRDIIGALVQSINGYKPEASHALQELVFDLYASFLQSAQSQKIPTPQVAELAPLVKWGKDRANPHTIFSTSVTSFPVAIVSLPIENASRDVLAWGTLGHETVGHDVLHAYDLLGEFQEFLRKHFSRPNEVSEAQYWVPRTDDLVSDVMGVLFMGPAAAIALIGLIRAGRDFFKQGRKLASLSDAEHPADLLRGYFMAEVVGHLKFTDAAKWREILISEVNRDAPDGAVPLSDKVRMNLSYWVQSIASLAKELVEHPWKALGNMPLSQLDTWTNNDESLVASLRPVLKDADKPLPSGTIYPAHVVAAAITASLEKDAKLDVIFKSMIKRINALPRHAEIFIP